MAQIRCKIALKDGQNKKIERNSGENSNLSTLSVNLKSIQKEINDYLTECVDKERAKQKGQLKGIDEILSFML